MSPQQIKIAEEIIELQKRKLALEQSIANRNDPYLRIGQLEGAIMVLILHLESAHPILAAKASWNSSEWADRNSKIIANLKTLIGEPE